MDFPELTDEQLAAEAAREGSDGPAFAALLSRYQQRVWQICYRLLGRAEDARDAAQEVFVRLFLNRTKFAGKSKYSTWVHSIAVHTCLSLRRGRSRRERRETLADEMVETKEGHAESTSPETRLDVGQMLEILDEEDRALLILKHAEGYGYEELAEMFGISTSAAKMRVSRARAKLQERFPEHRFQPADERGAESRPKDSEN